MHTKPGTTTISPDAIVDCDWSRSPTRHDVVVLPSPGHQPSGSAEDEFDACSPNATAENLKDLEQVISSHSASLPVADDCDEEIYLLKSSSFDLTSSLKSDNPALSVNSTVTIPLKTEPEHATDSVIKSDPDPFLCTVSHSSESNILTSQPVLVVGTCGIESTVSRPSSTHNSADHELHSGNPKVECASEVSLVNQDDVLVLDEQKHEDDMDFLLQANTMKSISNPSVSPCSPKLHPDIPSVGIKTICEPAVEDIAPEVIDSDLLNLNPVSSKVNGVSSEPDTGETVISETKSQTKQNPDAGEHGSLEEEEVYDEEEYVNAAVAAVDDVVFALAGNRKPDPSLEIDPALEGTGTDRIFTLSLGPVHHSEPPVCSIQSSCLLSTFSLNNISSNNEITVDNSVSLI